MRFWIELCEADARSMQQKLRDFVLADGNAKEKVTALDRYVDRAGGEPADPQDLAAAKAAVLAGADRATRGEAMAALDALLGTVPPAAEPPAAEPPSRRDYTDINYVKQRMAELAGASGTPWTVWNFDGHFFRGCWTVQGSPAIFREMAKAMMQWDRFFEKRAIFVQKPSEPHMLLLIWSDGVFHDPPVPVEHDSFNSNPGNDQSFQRRLPDLLDQIKQRKAG